MARLNIYLSDALAQALKHQDINISKICQKALARAGEVCPECGRPYEQEVVQPAKPVPERPGKVAGKRMTRTPRRGRTVEDRMEKMRQIVEKVQGARSTT